LLVPNTVLGPGVGEIIVARADAETTFTGVLGDDVTRFSAGERLGFRLRDAVSVSSASTEEKMRLLNVAIPDESAIELVEFEDRAASASFMVTVLMAGKNTVPLSVRVKIGAGESGTPMVAPEGGSVVKARA
jgi:hypothetical protein